MSTRALRKAQAAREKATLDLQHDSEAEGVDELPSPPPKQSIFSMLNEQGSDGAASNESEDEDSHREVPGEGVQRKSETSEQNSALGGKRKKKKKKKAKAKPPTESNETGPEHDEVEEALRALDLSSSRKEGNVTLRNDPAAEEAAKVLSIDLQHLHVGNEMRRLFGRAAFDADREEAAERRAAQLAMAQTGGQVQLGLADIVSGKYAEGGAGLSKLIRDRNVFVKGREEWPRISANGLGMQITEKTSNGLVQFRFTHDSSYQTVQRNFETIVGTMNPQMMVDSLRFHPYHVSTLLQVSEVAKHERDNATAGDLLERALFAFGRALHPTFADAIAHGKARLDFRVPENREFYLAAWRYIGNIGMRGTWRTAYEWAKLILTLNPEQDPYCMKSIIDQFALRAREHTELLKLIECSMFSERWSILPNIQFSKALALRSVKRDGKEASESLTNAVVTYPWLAARLCKDLGIDKIPPVVWGREAPSDWHALQTELYSTNALDLWKLPDSLSLFKTALENVQATDRASAPLPDIEIADDEPLMRQVLISEKPNLVRYIPQDILARPQSASDPLPPADNLAAYERFGSIDLESILGSRGDSGGSTVASPAEMLANQPREFIEELSLLQRYFELLVPGFARRSDGTENDEGDGFENRIDRALLDTQLTFQEIHSRVQRLVALRDELNVQPDSRVEDGEGNRASMGENGLAVITLEGHRPPSSLQEAEQAYTDFLGQHGRS